jgi:hypothetical protein
MNAICTINMQGEYYLLLYSLCRFVLKTVYGAMLFFSYCMKSISVCNQG